MTSKQPVSFPVKLFRFFSGYGLAVTCLLLLLVLTWLSTLEQARDGLYLVQKKYYDAEAWYVFPDLPFLYLPDWAWLPGKLAGAHVKVPLPGAYTVCAVLFVNLLLGGLVRIRKGWKNIGVIIAHFSMVSLLVAGFVAHHYSKEGVMFVFQGQESDFAQSYTDHTIEIFEIIDGQKTRPFVVPTESLKGLGAGDTLEVELPGLPFDLEVTNWMVNAKVMAASGDDPMVVDGMMLQEQPLRKKQREENASGCYVNVVAKKGEASPGRLLLGGGFENSQDKDSEVLIPNDGVYSVTVDGKVYYMNVVKEVWPMPFRVHLDESVGRYYPGTRKPSFFQSKITRIAGDGEKKFTIRMNEPMRYGGYTLYQARWSGETRVPQSGFAIVTNPSDQWPKWSLYVSMLGLTIHFGVKLFAYIMSSSRKQSTAS